MTSSDIDFGAIGSTPDILVGGDLPAANRSTSTSDIHSSHEKVKADPEKTRVSRPKDDVLEKLVDQFNEVASAVDVELRISVRKDSPNHISVKVINVDTNEVIREIPPEKFSFGCGSKLLDAVGFVIDEIA